MDEVFVEYGDSAGDTATLLLAAQEVAEQAGCEITEEDESGDDDG
jgi:hypothetical protein